VSNKFCSLKGYQKVFTLHLNSVASCCRAYPEIWGADQTIQDKIIQWKHEAQLLEQGVELPGCKVCWNDENQNKLSYRQREGQKEKSGSLIEIFLSNLCNQMCSYCSPRYSSMWENSIAKDGLFDRVSSGVNLNLAIPTHNQQVQNRLSQISDYIQSCDDNSVLLSLLGGEPLMQIQSLQTLLEFGQNKIKTLSIVTNLNPSKSKFLEWTLANIPHSKLRIKISLDATPEFNHIPRAGFDRSKFLENLELLKSHQIEIIFLSTVSATSIFDLPNFLSWIRDNRYSANFSSLNNPDCLNPEVVPLQTRQEILKQIKTEIPPMVDQILNYNQATVDLKLFEQYNYLTQYFSRTDTDLTNINNPLFREYWQWLTERFQK